MVAPELAGKKVFLSHLSGDEDQLVGELMAHQFLSHLSGDEVDCVTTLRFP